MANVMSDCRATSAGVDATCSCDDHMATTQQTASTATVRRQPQRLLWLCARFMGSFVDASQVTMNNILVNDILSSFFFLKP